MSYKNFIPEFQYYFHNIMINNYLNKFEVPLPTEVSSQYMPVESFIELLFNESYSYNTYKYLYSIDSNSYGWPSVVKTRTLIYPQTMRYHICGNTGQNLFSLTNEQLEMLNGLLLYRQRPDNFSVIDSTSVDSTNVIIIDSTTSILLEVNFDNLSPLSKLIYIYLDFKINQSVSKYNNETPIAREESLLELLYETYILDMIFQFKSTGS